jgi:hypothetical protein
MRLPRLRFSVLTLLGLVAVPATLLGWFLHGEYWYDRRAVDVWGGTNTAILFVERHRYLPDRTILRAAVLWTGCRLPETSFSIHGLRDDDDFPVWREVQQPQIGCGVALYNRLFEIETNGSVYEVDGCQRGKREIAVSNVSPFEDGIVRVFAEADYRKTTVKATFGDVMEFLTENPQAPWNLANLQRSIESH